MKKFTHSSFAKVTAVFLITIDLIVMIAIAFGIVGMIESEFYITSLSDLHDDVMHNMSQRYSYTAYDYYISGRDPIEHFSDKNFFFAIADEKGNLVSTNYVGQYNADTFSTNVNLGNYTIYGLISEEFAYDDQIVTAVKLVNLAYSMRYFAIILEVLLILTFFILLVFLFYSAGYRSGSDEVTLNPVAKLPFDVLSLGVLFIGLMEISILEDFYFSSDLIQLGFISVLFIADFLLLLFWALTMAVRLKLGNLFSSMVSYKILLRFFGLIHSGWHFVKYLFRQIPLVWKTVLIIIAVFVFEFFVMNIVIHDSDAVVVAWLLQSGVFAIGALFLTASLRTIQQGGKAIAKGDLDYQINTKYLVGDFKDFADDLNNIGDGLQNAVNEKVKSERFKTELITNVSHDIKTPLTSIINYVDLIKKENIVNERVNEYVDVLDRQSGRLKKLIEDLVEASKASTGNLAVHLESCDVGVLLDQAAAEYEDRLKSNQLELILSKPLFPVLIMADGRHLWRIFDNLFNNICKYAQPMTRIYLDVQVLGEDSVITFRNVSKYPLNISSEELMERFVRGDSSRNTEGNGLGLSIARSLADLQNGSLDLVIDGDLFKVSLKFKMLEAK